MPRYKRKKHLYSGSDGKSNGKTTDTNDLTGKQKTKLREYLDQYRRGATKVHDKEAGNETTTSEENKQQGGNVINIANVTLPQLTDQVLEQKYLSLPVEFSFRQRQFIHDCCIDLRIYHIGLGKHGSSERYIAISIFADAFDEISSQFRPKYLHFYKPFKPWYCQHSNSAFRDELTKTMRTKIQALIDQPSTCLREDMDVLDFNELEGHDLTTVTAIADSEWMLVDTAEKMEQCIHELTDGPVTELAFDVEAYNPSKYCQQTCLLQLASNLNKEYVIDTLAEGVWDKVGGLGQLFANPNIVKIGHSIGGLDVRCLHRDFGIFLCNVFDTYEASRVLNLPSQGLAAVCEYYGMDTTKEYADLKAQYQTTDWRQRPLTEEMILYGRYDVHFLLQLRLLMMRDLTHSELFLGGDEEGKLVAESLAATLQRIHDFEDGVEFETASESESFGYDNTSNGNNEAVDDEDDRMFKTSNSDVYEDVDDGLIDESQELVKTTKIAPANVLRMQPRLMRVISMSQDRCMDLWTAKAEPAFRNALFCSHMNPPKPPRNTSNNKRPQNQKLTQSQVRLYEDLVRLRSNKANKEECLPAFLCSLDDLARIAIGRPTSMDALRIISFFLPESVEGIVDQIFVLTKQSLKSDGKQKGHLDLVVKKYKKDNNKDSLLALAGKVVLASVAFGALCLVLTARNKKLRR